MQNKVKLLIILCAIFVLLANFTVACDSAQVPTTSTPTFVPSVTATSSPIPSLTPTIAPSPLPTKVLEPLSFYDLPVWMKDAQTDILVDLFIKEEVQDLHSLTSSKLSFLNASTGEWYDMQIPLHAGKYFWYDNMHFGFLSNDLRTMYLIDLSTGQVSSESVSPNTTRFLEAGDGFYPLRILRNPLLSEDFIFDNISYAGTINYSKNLSYFVTRGSYKTENSFTVTNEDSGDVVWQSNPSDSYWGVTYAWSPVNDSYLAIIQGKLEEKWSDFPTKDMTLIVYDVKTGNLIASHNDDVGRIQWSPDGTSILYQDWRSLYWNLGYAFTDSPCIFNIQTGEKKCLRNIPRNHIPNGYSLLTTSRYQWSPDGNSIIFIYTYTDVQKQMEGNICIYDLVSGQFTCPTDRLSELPEWKIDWPYGWSINYYDFSPNMEYVHFCYSANHPISDDQGGPTRDGMIDIEGTSLVSWYGLEFRIEASKCSASWGIWRPLP